jgi:hypothetical protein
LENHHELTHFYEILKSPFDTDICGNPNQRQYGARREPRRRCSDAGQRSFIRNRRREDQDHDKSLAISADQHQKSYRDPQDQARQLILGKPSFNGPISREFAVQSKTNVPVPASARRNGHVHTDPQELARRMILGAGGSGRESAGMRLSGTQEVKK